VAELEKKIKHMEKKNDKNTGKLTAEIQKYKKRYEQL
jgi:hypothetical protein